jgi:hypothetical protein
METPEGLLVPSEQIIPEQVVTEGPFLDAADTVSALETLSAFETIVDLKRDDGGGDNTTRQEEQAADVPSRSVEEGSALISEEIPTGGPSALGSAEPTANVDGDVIKEPTADQEQIVQTEEPLEEEDENAKPNVTSAQAPAAQGVALLAIYLPLVNHFSAAERENKKIINIKIRPKDGDWIMGEDLQLSVAFDISVTNLKKLIQAMKGIHYKRARVATLRSKVPIPEARESW